MLTIFDCIDEIFRWKKVAKIVERASISFQRVFRFKNMNQLNYLKKTNYYIFTCIYEKWLMRIQVYIQEQKITTSSINDIIDISYQYIYILI